MPLTRLQLYISKRSFIPADGNCQFHAISDQLDYLLSYRALRTIAVDWMQAHPDQFAHGKSMYEFQLFLAGL
jgi:hypothetical protein